MPARMEEFCTPIITAIFHLVVNQMYHLCTTLPSIQEVLYILRAIAEYYLRETQQ